MIEYVKLFLPNSQKEITLEISIPRYYDKNFRLDTLYLLDGQNAFKDANATYNRAIRAGKYLGYISSITNHQIIGVAIHNAGSDLGRINEYSPFKITYAANKEWQKQNLSVFRAFAEDVSKVIIPYIEKRYPTTNRRFIYGSSLSAVTAIYLGYKYPLFAGVGAFSTAGFLFPEDFFKFIDKHLRPEVKIFLYVGRKEESDGSYNRNLYYQTSLDLLEKIAEKTANVRLVVSESGSHCEAVWEKHLMDFLSYMYFDNIYYKT